MTSSRFWKFSLLVFYLVAFDRMLSARERVAVYVSASETAVGDPKDIADSVKDIQREIKGSRRLSLAKNARNAQVIVRVLARGVDSNNFVRAEMQMDAFKQDVSASAQVGDAYSWAECAEKVTKNVIAWLDRPTAFRKPPPPTADQIAAAERAKAARIAGFKARFDLSTSTYIQCLFASADTHVKSSATPSEIAEGAIGDCLAEFTVYRMAMNDFFWESGREGGSVTQLALDSREDFRRAVISRILKARDPKE